MPKVLITLLLLLMPIVPLTDRATGAPPHVGYGLHGWKLAFVRGGSMEKGQPARIPIPGLSRHFSKEANNSGRLNQKPRFPAQRRIRELRHNP